MRPSKSAKKLPSSNSSSNSTLTDDPKASAKSSADLRIPSPAESTESKLSKLGISPPAALSKSSPKSPYAKKLGFAVTEASEEEPEMAGKGSKWTKGARRASLDLATALMIPTLNVGKIKSAKNFLSGTAVSIKQDKLQIIKADAVQNKVV